jgi:FXSXX-COOH protein
MGESDGEIESELVDLTDLTLEQVRSLGESALGGALHRVRTEHENPAEPFAGFQSSVPRLAGRPVMEGGSRGRSDERRQ